LNHRKPRPAPAIAAQKIAISPGAGNRRDLQVLREHRVAGGVGEHAERGRDQHRRHDRQSVEAVGQVDRVGKTDDPE
jgi:hypothetical protein